MHFYRKRGCRGDEVLIFDELLKFFFAKNEQAGFSVNQAGAKFVNPDNSRRITQRGNRFCDGAERFYTEYRPGISINEVFYAGNGGILFLKLER